MAMNGKRDARLEARWRGLVEKHVGSGLGVREFCRRRKITESAFYFWRRELDRRGRERNNTNPQKYVQKKPQSRTCPSAPAAFVPVRVAQEVRPLPCGGVAITLPGGVRVHVSAPVDREALADVLAVLEAR